VIVQVLPNARQVGFDVDAERPQLLGRSDAGQQQQLR
jgi:hypothetical protein